MRRRRATLVARPPRAVKEDDKRTVEGFDTEAESFADSELFGNLLKARPRPAPLLEDAQADSRLCKLTGRYRWAHGAQVLAFAGIAGAVGLLVFLAKPLIDNTVGAFPAR